MAWLSNSLLISGVVLFSMTLQLVLAFGGSLRHRSSNRILQLLLWLAYMSADAVAIYALGTMVHHSTYTIRNSSSAIFGVWAPLLLLHLGGPDTITAYSTVDNELWRRHLVNMLYQISVAIFVMHLSKMKSDLLAAAIILLLVGGSKYAEKTVALRLASHSQIVNSCQPVYKYMSIRDHPERYSYAVMGLKKWERNWNRRNIAPTTIRDVWEYEDQIASENYILCLCHALFRMNMRRYADLYIHESSNEHTRKFFFTEVSHLSPEQIFTVIEMELKFMYDALFSKSSRTAFSKWGTIMRIMNICLLAVGGFLLYRELVPGDEEVGIEIQRRVTYTVISVALLVELLQLLRVIASDWTLVWLICSAIREQKAQQARRERCVVIPLRLLGKIRRLQVKRHSLRIALGLLGKIRRLRGRHYWKKSIQKYSLIETCTAVSPFMWKLARSLDLADILMSWYIKSEPIEDEFKQFITGKLRDMSMSVDGLNSTEEWRVRIRSYNDILEPLGEDLKSWASGSDHEHLILQWHIATTICEMDYTRKTRQDPEVKSSEIIKRNVGVSRTISNYCAYLLVSKRNLLPLHSDVARMESLDVHSELLDFLSTPRDIQHLRENYGIGNRREGRTTLENGAELARQLLEKSVAEQWTILSEYWAAVLIYYADFNKPIFHAEQLSIGGEFITQLWALLGHMGFGTQA